MEVITEPERSNATLELLGMQRSKEKNICDSLRLKVSALSLKILI